MPRPRQPAAPGYRRLEQRLSLLAWLNDQLGYADTREMLEDLKTSGEGFAAEGEPSPIYSRMAGRRRQPKIALEQLRGYDANIRRHLDKINAGARRGEPVTLRYFQYLAALTAEIYLDRWFAGPEKLRDELNAFIGAERSRGRREAEQWGDYETADLSKLAFWMATGSGKTLLLHLNYYQFQHYRRQYRRDAAPLKNILLITPNEGLSRQHLDELKLSNIGGAAPFDLRSAGGSSADVAPLRTIEITKLVMEKTGAGESVPVAVFEPENLIFVDEGHKGSGGEAWRQARDALGETGFTFEYSATFGQALAAAQNAALLAEYGKSIAFDYSYRYFYGDGYGKEFRILNLRQETTAENTDALLLANLLSFYQQQRFYAARARQLTDYNLERPLAVFVGGSVNAVYTESRRPRSDVLTVCRFLHRVLSQPDWAVAGIAQLLQGRSGFQNPDTGQDLFAGQFAWLSGQLPDAAAVYRDLLRETLRVDQPDAPGGLVMRDLQSSDGELGLIAAGAADYFGVINIGDANAFKKLVRENAPEIAPEDDFITPSLFAGINRPEAPVNLLIGSRKFMEGWNSWRVATMGLLNIGKSEGSQIIQLFGRGVRLKGRAMSLKRSSADPAPEQGRHPENLPLLETLNIFALRADYMAKFREYLENEGIDEGIALAIPIRSNGEFLGKNLVLPRLDETAQFDAAEVVVLRYSPAAVQTPVTVDLSAAVGILQSGQPDAGLAVAGQEVHLAPEKLELVDWPAARLNLLEYKTRKGYHCLVLPAPENLREILAAHTPDKPVYRLIAEAAVGNPANYAEWQRLQGAVTAILQQYADALYRQRRMNWESQRLVYKTLEEADPDFQFNAGAGGGQYRLRVFGERRDELARQIKSLLDDCNALYRQDDDAPLPRIHFDRHLYQPLLFEPAKNIVLSPPGLNAGERDFVRDLRKFWAQKRESLPADTEVFLLRNQGRGRGVGFYETRRFFPDFILWVKNGAAQRIIFVEPHGMRHELPYRNNEKAALHARLPQLAADIAQRSGAATAVELDAFIVSVTPYAELTGTFDDGSWSRERFAENHILFREGDREYDYLEIIFRVARAVG